MKILVRVWKIFSDLLSTSAKICQKVRTCLILNTFRFKYYCSIFWSNFRFFEFFCLRSWSAYTRRFAIKSLGSNVHGSTGILHNSRQNLFCCCGLSTWIFSLPVNAAKNGWCFSRSTALDVPMPIVVDRLWGSLKLKKLFFFPPWFFWTIVCLKLIIINT